MSARPAVLITGGAKRVGAVMCSYFAKRGYDIALHYNRSEKEAQAVKKQVEALGAKCELFALDIADIAALPGLIKNVHAKMPSCKTLINNASIFERASFMETDEALFDRQMNVNFKAPFFLTQSFAKTMGDGCVINLLDTDIVETHGSHFIYLQSKKALADFTAMAARELGPKIRVNGVCPAILLPSNELDEAYIKKIEATIPLRSRPSIEEVCEAAYWLTQQRHITGQVIFVDERNMPSKQKWKIHVKNMEVNIRIGIRPDEKEPQRVRVSAEVEGFYPANPKSIEECFNYEHIYEFVAQWPKRPHVWLLENCVYDLLTHIFTVDDTVELAKVSACKPNRFPGTESVGVEAQWTRAEFERLKS